MVTRADVQTALNLAAGHARMLADSIEGLDFAVDRRVRFAQLLWHHAVDDTEASVLLIRERLVGSARALVRPQFEALARSGWMLHLATEEDLDGLENGDGEPPGLNRVVTGLAKHPVGLAPLGMRFPFDDWLQRARGILHDATHRGAQALARMTYLQTHDDLVAIDEPTILFMSGVMGQVAALSRLDSVGAIDRAERLFELSTGMLRQIQPLALDERTDTN